MLAWITSPEIWVEASSPKLEIGIATWLHVLAAGATGKFIAFPIGSPVMLYNFTEAESADLALVPPFT